MSLQNYLKNFLKTSAPKKFLFFYFKVIQTGQWSEGFSIALAA